ncbi:MAG: deoxyribonuclease IV [Candidatus Omnitrophica bacterium]|nr:deoxyribonuclease IV [Candidatus Omnitrophota bacterium]
MLKLGVHVSISGNIYKSVDRAEQLGCNTMQIFSRNPRQWRKENLSQEDIQKFRQKILQAKIKPLVIHIPYTLNLASSRRSFYKTTIRDFILDLEETDKLGANFLITHMGSYKGGTEIGGLLRVINALKKILKETAGNQTVILLENTSGSGSWLGYKFSHHRFILEELGWSERVGVCLDTAHAWAAGYKIDNVKGVEDLLTEIDKEVGIKRLKVVHLNDTQEALGSKKDRHLAIGQGNIGRRGFKAIINHPDLQKTAFILETPKDSDEDDINNLRAVRKLYNQ